MSSRVIIIGAGGHAKVVADALLSAGMTLLGFIDRDVATHGRMLCNAKVLGDDQILNRYHRDEVWLANGIGGVGDTSNRMKVQLQIERAGWKFVDVRHASATVSSFARIGRTVQLLAGAIVQPDAILDEGCIVNTRAVIEHDVHLGAWVHVAPGAVICGNSKVGSQSHVGAGSVIRNGIVVGPSSVIGAGAVVVKNFDGHGKLVGVPARLVRGCR